MSKYGIEDPTWRKRKKLLSSVIGEKNATKLLKHFSELNAVARAEDEVILDVAPELAGEGLETLKAAFQLGASINSEGIPRNYRITQTSESAAIFKQQFQFSDVVHRRMIIVDRKGYVLDTFKVENTQAGILICRSPRELMEHIPPKLRNSGEIAGIFLAHNHLVKAPYYDAGTLETPDGENISLYGNNGDPLPHPFERKKCLDTVALFNSHELPPVLDVIVIGNPTEQFPEGYCSFDRMGYMPNPEFNWKYEHTPPLPGREN